MGDHAAIFHDSTDCANSIELSWSFQFPFALGRFRTRVPKRSHDEITLPKARLQPIRRLRPPSTSSLFVDHNHHRHQLVCRLRPPSTTIHQLARLSTTTTVSTSSCAKYDHHQHQLVCRPRPQSASVVHNSWTHEYAVGGTAVTAYP